jgi:hypothetical protein
MIGSIRHIWVRGTSSPGDLMPVASECRGTSNICEDVECANLSEYNSKTFFGDGSSARATEQIPEFLPYYISAPPFPKRQSILAKHSCKQDLRTDELRVRASPNLKLLTTSLISQHHVLVACWGVHSHIRTHMASFPLQPWKLNCKHPWRCWVYKAISRKSKNTLWGWELSWAECEVLASTFWCICFQSEVTGSITQGTPHDHLWFGLGFRV